MDPTLSPQSSRLISAPKMVTPNEKGDRPPSDVGIDTPSENDVLCGRGGSINSHPGNERFRTLVEKRKRVYLTARFKREKRLIASTIVNEIRSMNPPGRFLTKKGGKDGLWYDIGDEKARDKTSQALRENAPSLRAEIETEINQQREEMKRKEEGEAREANKAAAVSPRHGAPYGPPPSHYYPPQQWGYYYPYYGYAPPYGSASPGGGHGPPPPPHSPHGGPEPHPPHPPPHGHQPHGPPPHGPPPPHGYPGHPPEAYDRRWERCNSRDECNDEGSSSHDYEDHTMEMQHPNHDRRAHYDARKRRHYSETPLRVSDHRGPFPVRDHQDGYRGDYDHWRSPRAAKAPPSSASPVPSAAAAKPHRPNDTSLSQEELDHRLAVALQEREDNAVRMRRKSGSVRMSSSNAYSQARRVAKESAGLFAGFDDSSYFSSSVSSSLYNWTKSNVGFGSQSTEDVKQPAMPKQIMDVSKPDMDGTGTSRRSVTFKDDPDIRVREYDRDMAYSPINLQRDNSLVSSQEKQLQARNGDGSDEQNSSVLSQVANHILGSIGSWETHANMCNQESHHGGAPMGGGVSANGSMVPHAANAVPLDVSDMAMDDSVGHEVQIRDTRDEASMPPPQPKVQIDWPSRVGSCHAWIPETIGAGAASFFGASTDSVTGGNPSSRRSSMSLGISPVNSLELDGSNNEHFSCASSVGGGSLCQVFEKDEVFPSPMNAQRVLFQVPSWERSMRSKSPLSMESEEDDSLICVQREKDKIAMMHQYQHQNHHHSNNGAPGEQHPEDEQSGESGGDMDWEVHHPE